MFSLHNAFPWIGVLFFGAGLGLLAARQVELGAAAMGVSLILFIAMFGMWASRSRYRARPDEPEKIEGLDEDRRVELLRGTSMHLRDMNYRYSIRIDRSERSPFTAEVNTVVLGFVPVVILDNGSERQGYGYVAFPYDGSRWRGPGLPCAGDRAAALEHAARCVAPLE